MRLATFLLVCHSFLVIALVGIAASGIAILDEVKGTGDRVLRRRLALASAAQRLETALLGSELARREGERPGPGRDAFREALALARGASAGGKTDLVLAGLERSVDAYLEGKGSVERPIALSRELASRGSSELRDDLEHAGRTCDTGMGLLAVGGALALVLALLFGWWLSRRLAQPLEGLVKGLEAVQAGDLGRRLSADGSTGAIAELAAGLNTLADRIQRLEAAPRRDLLLACAALERLLEPAGGARGVVTPEGRLLASNEEARRLVLERGASFAWIAGDLAGKEPARVEATPLQGPGGEELGRLVSLRLEGRLDPHRAPAPLQ
ncbi:MAG: HAMP domain-containing protein [Planctomycetes bacterium]|nr:HAMP domain-containing protein [Planctomycetota bacterium]